MSKGPGPVQRAILDATQDGGVYPLLAIAKDCGHDVAELSVRQSFARAARQLAKQGLIASSDIEVPTMYSGLRGYSHHRNITCVHHADAQPTDEHWKACRSRAFDVFFPDAAR